jgi:non-ribosomal peptide synthetase component F
MAIEKANVENIYPLTPMQEGMLFHALKEPRSTAYFEQMSWRVRGVVDVPLLERCWNALIRRHATLRSLFTHQNADRPLQIVLRERPLTIDVHDLHAADRDATDPRAAINAFKSADRARGFALDADPLLRVAVLNLGDDEQEIVWSHHHIILDGWSVGLLLGELLELYRVGRRGEQHALAPITPFSRYVKWLEARDRDASLAFWQEALQDLAEPVTVPHTRTESSIATRGTAVFDLGERATSELNALASGLDVTVPVVLHAVWALLLARYNDAADVVFGSVVSGRTPDVPGIERMVGNFINTIPVRVRFERDQTFADLAARMHADAARAEPHHVVPLGRIQSARHAGDALFGTLVSYASYPIDATLKQDPAGTLGFAIEDVAHEEQTHYDVDVQFVPSVDLHVRITYAQGLYEPSQIDAIAGHFRAIVDAVLRDAQVRVDAIELLTADERAHLLRGLVQWQNDSEAETLVSAFERRAAAMPDQCAVAASDGRLTYGELNARANALARRLREACTIAPDDRVALLLGRTTELAIGILGVLKAGACYVPLDPALPEDRVDFILNDAECRAVVVGENNDNPSSALRAPSPLTRGEGHSAPATPDSSVFAHSPGSAAGVAFSPPRGEKVPKADEGYVLVSVTAAEETADIPNPPPAASASNLAYVIYTSGSTGVPKGVMIEHAAACRSTSTTATPGRCASRSSPRTASTPPYNNSSPRCCTATRWCWSMKPRAATAPRSIASSSTGTSTSSTAPPRCSRPSRTRAASTPCAAACATR